MTTLTDTQLVILNAAAQRDRFIALPLPTSLRGGAATKVVIAMIARNLLAEEAAATTDVGTIWRRTEDGKAITLVATTAGLAAIGIEPDRCDEEDVPTKPDAGSREQSNDDGSIGQLGPVVPSTPEANDAALDEAAADLATASTPKTPNTRTGTKQARLIAMLQRQEGATIAEIMADTGWQAHTVRGSIAGSLRKKLGLVVISEKVDGRGRVYTMQAPS